MKRFLVLSCALLIAVALASCGTKSEQSTASSTSAESTATAPPAAPDSALTAGWTEPPGLDGGARASTEPVDDAVANHGGQVFKDKGCVTCHAFGKKVIGPDLLGVPKQRTSSWMIAWVLHPDKMIVQDSISKALLAQYKVPMTNQHLTPDEAKSVVEYIKYRDKQGK